MCLFVRFFAVTNLCHEASRGQAVIYTNSLPQPFLDLGVITWEQNGFISFNPAAAAICAGNICSCGVCTVKQLETSKSLKYKQGRGGNNQGKNLCRRWYYPHSNWKSMFQDEIRFKFTRYLSEFEIIYVEQRYWIYWGVQMTSHHPTYTPLFICDFQQFLRFSICM